MGNTIGGNLEKVLWAEVGVFGATFVVFFLWVLFGKRAYLRPLLWPFTIAAFIRTFEALLMLYGQGTSERSGDHRLVTWLPWAFGIFVYGLIITPGFMRFIRVSDPTSILTVQFSLATASAAVLGATFSSAEPLRIIWTIAAFCAWLFAFVTMLFKRGRVGHTDPKHVNAVWSKVIFIVLFNLSLAASGALFVAGPSFTRRVSRVNEQIGRFIPHVFIYSITTIWCLVLHCNCPDIDPKQAYTRPSMRNSQKQSRTEEELMGDELDA